MHVIYFQVPEPKNLSEDEEDLVVSDPEDAFQKQRRLQIKQRNRRLVVDDAFLVEKISLINTVKSRKKLDVFWKLYRLPGESVEDTKNRLLDSIENQVEIKTEVLSDKGEDSNAQEHLDISVKEEPECIEDTNDEFSLKIQQVNQCNEQHEENSDSDPDDVGILVKQEYNNVEEDSEMEIESCGGSNFSTEHQEEDKSSDSEEESEWDSDDDSEEEIGKEKPIVENCFYMNSQNYINVETNVESCNLEDPEADDGSEEHLLLSNMLEIQIDEDKENIFTDVSNTMNNNDNETDDVNWSFERSELADNSALTRLALNPAYKTSKPKPIGDKEKNRKIKKTVPAKTKRVPKLVIKKEPYYHVTSSPETQPLVYDMYGTRTINYDHYPTSKDTRWQSCTLLSDSSGEEEPIVETIASRIKKEHRRTLNGGEIEPDQEQTALELKNWFPKTRPERNRKRKYSDSSWVGSDFFDDSDLDEADVKLIEAKRVKRSANEQEEFQAETTMSTSGKPLTSAEDLSTVKVESRSSSPLQDLIGFTKDLAFSMKPSGEEKDVVQNEKPMEDNDATSDSDSDSSSCCSRSSCSCSSSSSSSSSSNDDENDKPVKKED